MRKSREGGGLKRAGLADPVAPPVVAPPPLIVGDAHFLPIRIAAPSEPARANRPERIDAAAATPSVIEIELRRGPLHLNVRWLSAAAGDCLAWLNELRTDLAK